MGDNVIGSEALADKLFLPVWREYFEALGLDMSNLNDNGIKKMLSNMNKEEEKENIGPCLLRPVLVRHQERYCYTHCFIGFGEYEHDNLCRDLVKELNGDAKVSSK